MVGFWAASAHWQIMLSFSSTNVPKCFSSWLLSISASLSPGRILIPGIALTQSGPYISENPISLYNTSLKAASIIAKVRPQDRDGSLIELDLFWSCWLFIQGRFVPEPKGYSLTVLKYDWKLAERWGLGGFLAFWWSFQAPYKWCINTVEASQNHWLLSQ